MVTGRRRVSYLRGLTNRLRAAHPGLNAVRDTLQDSPQLLGRTLRHDTLKPSLIPHQPVRRPLRALLVVAAFLGLLATAAPAAAAAESCGRKVIDDWYDDGRVDGTYDLHCYNDAIRILPRDVREYSSAKEDIQRALQNRRRGDPSPPARTDPSREDAPPAPPDDPEETTETTGSPPPRGPDDPPTDTVASPPVDTESASSVPIPLLILAGLALLLIAGGSAGYVIRRLQARRPPPSAA